MRERSEGGRPEKKKKEKKKTKAVSEVHIIYFFFFAKDVDVKRVFIQKNQGLANMTERSLTFLKEVKKGLQTSTNVGHVFSSRAT